MALDNSSPLKFVYDTESPFLICRIRAPDKCATTSDKLHTQMVAAPRCVMESICLFYIPLIGTLVLRTQVKMVGMSISSVS
jgi:hypothetical protein